jgi:hypothetical protein
VHTQGDGNPPHYHYSQITIFQNKYRTHYTTEYSGFGGLVVSMLVSGTQDRRKEQEEEGEEEEVVVVVSCSPMNAERPTHPKQRERAKGEEYKLQSQSPWLKMHLTLKSSIIRITSVATAEA